MKIETKFDVNNLVKRKFDADTKDGFVAMEVMEIVSQTCYAGTQVFYSCRHIYAKREFKGFGEKEFTWSVGHGVSKEDAQMGWQKYREDELVEAPQNQIDIILGGNTKKVR
jgi:hypothetical protein